MCGYYEHSLCRYFINYTFCLKDMNLLDNTCMEQRVVPENENYCSLFYLVIKIWFSQNNTKYTPNNIEN